MGEEAIQIGSAAALSSDDVVLAQYREVGVFLWRGFDVQNVADQLFSNEADSPPSIQPAACMTISAPPVMVPHSDICVSSAACASGILAAHTPEER